MEMFKNFYLSNKVIALLHIISTDCSVDGSVARFCKWERCIGAVNVTVLCDNGQNLEQS